MSKWTRRAFLAAGLTACGAEAFRRERHRAEPLGEAVDEHLILTVDSTLQRAAIDTVVAPISALVRRGKMRRSMEIAMVAIHTETGAVLVYIPRRDLGTGFDVARLGRRDIGSLAKVFCYASAFAQGSLREDDLLEDYPRIFACPDVPGGRLRVDNAHGSYTRRNLLPSEAIALSSNVCATDVNLRQDRIGYSASLARLGFTPPNTPAKMALAGISLEATLIELTGALSVFARRGSTVRPHLIERASAPAPVEVFPEWAVQPVISGMRDCLTRGTGRSVRRHAADFIGKTGTSFDALAALIGPRLVVAARLCDGAAYRDIKIAGSFIMELLGDFLDRVAAEHPDLYR